jgi:hypothetical protein
VLKSEYLELNFVFRWLAEQTATNVFSWPKVVPAEGPLFAHTGYPVRRWQLDFGLLRDFECIINSYAEIPHRALELSMAEKQLHGTQISRSPVGQGCLRSPS